MKTAYMVQEEILEKFLPNFFTFMKSVHSSICLFMGKK